MARHAASPPCRFDKSCVDTRISPINVRTFTWSAYAYFPLRFNASCLSLSEHDRIIHQGSSGMELPCLRGWYLPLFTASRCPVGLIVIKLECPPSPCLFTLVTLLFVFVISSFCKYLKNAGSHISEPVGNCLLRRRQKPCPRRQKLTQARVKTRLKDFGGICAFRPAPEAPEQ